MVHRITRGDLDIKGRPAAEVARRVVEALGGKPVFSDAPGFDGGWLDVLLSAGGYPSDVVRVADVADAYTRASNLIYDDLTDEGVDRETGCRTLISGFSEAKTVQEHPWQAKSIPTSSASFSERTGL